MLKIRRESGWATGNVQTEDETEQPGDGRENSTCRNGLLEEFGLPRLSESFLYLS